ncbi:hypothetical protein G6F22_020006 [Rhizopus arrhizus]|nr:hypothetical protein G6F22_020006 [Rhizopus arrhizus]KAG1217747.1 hypothetical protein G6F35_008888 [Rhizopus arrhizus]KAG1253104.1 hypothetical protein G6F65_017617 [Rhizopus arrhizus]
MDLGGDPTSSRGTMTSFLPSTPPAALISSAACRAPDKADTPKSAEPLADMSLLYPILISLCAQAPCAAIAKAAANARRVSGFCLFIALSPDFM